MTRGIVLLTGSSGFVGSRVLQVLLSKGRIIRCIERAGRFNTMQFGNPNIEIIESEDIFSESEEWWAIACKDVEIIIHTAWYTNTSDYLISMNNLSCHLGTLRFASGAIKAGVRRFLALGTSYEYEMSSSKLSTDSPFKPKSIYANCKLATYLALLSLFSNSKVSFLWCRLFDIYGVQPGSKRLIPYIYQQIEKGLDIELSEGLSIRDFMHVDDVAKELVRAADMVNVVGAINICSGIPISVREMAIKVAKEKNSMHLLKFGVREAQISEPLHVVGLRSIF